MPCIVTRISSNQELYHHGVKGMHWGVRRVEQTNSNGQSDKEEPKGLSDKQKKALIVGTTATVAALALIGGIYVYKKTNTPVHFKEMSFGKILDLDKMSMDDTILKPGSKMQRISSKKLEDYVEDGQRMYVSHLKSDNRIYTEEMPDYIRRWARQGMVESDGSAYKHILKAKTEIKIPSERKLAEIYMKTTNSPHVDDGQYKRFMENLVNTENPEIQKFFKSVSDAGYNAVVDGNDAGSLTKMPLILLNPKKDVTFSGSHKIRKLESVINVLLM